MTKKGFTLFWVQAASCWCWRDGSAVRALAALPEVLYCHSKPPGTAVLARMLSSVPPCIVGIFLKISSFSFESSIEMPLGVASYKEGGTEAVSARRCASPSPTPFLRRGSSLLEKPFSVQQVGQHLLLCPWTCLSGGRSWSTF